TRIRPETRYAKNGNINIAYQVVGDNHGGGWDVRSGRYLAEHIPGARFVELPGGDFSPSVGEQEPLFSELGRFLADVVAGTHPEVRPARGLAPVVFLEIVGPGGDWGAPVERGRGGLL